MKTLLSVCHLKDCVNKTNYYWQCVTYPNQKLTYANVWSKSTENTEVLHSKNNAVPVPA